MSNTINLPAFVEVWLEGADRSRRDSMHLASNCGFCPVELVVTDPELQARAVHKGQLKSVLRKVKDCGLWSEMAKRAAERKS